MGRQLHADLALPEQLKDFWYPVAFSSQLTPGAMVTLELFGQAWVLFRDAQGLAACVHDACAHRACPLSLVGSSSCPHVALCSKASVLAAALGQLEAQHGKDGFCFVLHFLQLLLARIQRHRACG
jgi:hypothetical protein